MELLSPAGNRESLIAAISCGADAVYLGYTSFGARSYAGNFDAEQLHEAVDYVHERGKKIFVTVNTLIKQSELDDLGDVFELLCQYGVDAIIIQDLGAVKIAREHFPELVLHASTQMTVHNAYGARLLQSQGFTRIVPARECSLAELKKMADTGIEIEAFAHGALCVAVSGQCLFSSMIGGRSGNRGRCAQPCRLPYGLDDGTRGYLLSTRDLMLIDRLAELRDAGVYSYKLEGRMKRPEYVGVVTHAYREALDAAEAHVPYHPSKQTIDELKQIFNRGGFTEGYAMQKSNAALMSWERPSHWGIRLGKITALKGQLAEIKLSESLGNGDGLQIRGEKEIETVYSGKPCAKGTETLLRIPVQGAKIGDTVYRLTQEKQMQDIRERISKEYAPIHLDAHLTLLPGKTPELALRDDDGHSILVRGETPADTAQSKPIDEQLARKQIQKMGGTPYVLRNLELTCENAFIPTGVLNDLRRKALEAIRAERIAIKKLPCSVTQMPFQYPEAKRQLIAQCMDLSKATLLLNHGADQIEWYPINYDCDKLNDELDKNAFIKPILVLPAVISTEELKELHAWICTREKEINGVVLNNIGQFELSWPVPIYGGQGLNVLNSECAKYYFSLGAVRLRASCELSGKELQELIRSGGNFDIESYGRTQLMLLSHCPKRTIKGDTVQDHSCNACEHSGGQPCIYTDRKGYQFPVRRLKMPHGCLLRLYNSVVTDMAKNMRRLNEINCSLTVSFVDERDDRMIEITSSYKNILLNGNETHVPNSNATCGHLLRGVE